MIYLKKFETTAQYEAAESSLILPNVSFISETNGVHYKPYVPTPSHEYVEIGGVKWATMNIGANSITDTGLYFQWGDTQGYTADQVGSGEGQKYFDWRDCKFNPSHDGETFTKYNPSDGKTVLDASDDAVTAAWGGNWRMPTTEEFVALGAAVNTAWTADYEGSGVSGIVLTSTADTNVKLFFPAVGRANGGSVENEGSYGFYWSSSLYLSSVLYEKVANAYHLSFDSYPYLDWQEYSYRYFGYQVRGVLDE